MTEGAKTGAGNDASAADAGTSDARRLLGQVISGRYRIDELIGEGGMGAVYRATHTHMRKRLAVKVLHPEMLHLTEAVERFEREAIAGAHIEHPNVAAATDFGKLEDGSHFLVLELLEGEDLRTIIGRSALTPERAVKIVRQIALALRAAHQLGIVHRDLKPENIMLVKRDREADVVKVLDFGIAKVPVNDLATTRGSRTAQALTQLGMVYGTPEYMAPEQALGEEIDGRADLYAVGVMFYEMLCGFRPFDADSRVALLGQVATKKPPSLGQRVPGTVVPREIEEIVMRLLEKTAAARYADADELVEALDIAILELDYSMSPAASLGRTASNPDRSGAHRQVLPSVAERAGPFRPPVPSVLEAAPSRASKPDLREVRAEAATVAPTGGVRAPVRAATGLPGRALTSLRRPQAGGLPPAALLAGVGLAGIGLSIFLAVLLRSDESVAALEASGLSAASPSGSAGARMPGGGNIGSGATSAVPVDDDDRPTAEGRASRAELASAKAKGLTALGPLAQRFPGDPDVLKALLLAHASDRAGYAAALGVARRLFEVSPEAAGDEEIRTVILMAANAKPEVSSLAFDLMSTAMGSKGPDLLYELASAPSVGKLPKERAEKLLKDPAVKKLATPALLVANDLRTATGCARKPFFSRAAKDGDARALGYLKPLLVTNGCSSGGFLGRIVGDRSDCYRCLGNRADLRDAVDAIEGRLEKNKKTD